MRLLRNTYTSPWSYGQAIVLRSGTEPQSSVHPVVSEAILSLGPRPSFGAQCLQKLCVPGCRAGSGRGFPCVLHAIVAGQTVCWQPGEGICKGRRSFVCSRAMISSKPKVNQKSGSCVLGFIRELAPKNWREKSGAFAGGLGGGSPPAGGRGSGGGRFLDVLLWFALGPGGLRQAPEASGRPPVAPGRPTEGPGGPPGGPRGPGRKT